MAFDHLSPADQPVEAVHNEAQSRHVTAKPHRFVSFYFGETHYAIPARAVAEVTGHLSPTPLPDSPRSLLGIAPHRGDILAIVDAGLGSTASDPAKKKAIVMQPMGNQVEVSLAFNVDRIGEMIQLAPSDIRKASKADPVAEFETSVNGNSLLIIEPSRIADLARV